MFVGCILQPNSSKRAVARELGQSVGHQEISGLCSSQTTVGRRCWKLHQRLLKLKLAKGARATWLPLCWNIFLEKNFCHHAEQKGSRTQKEAPAAHLQEYFNFGPCSELSSTVSKYYRIMTSVKSYKGIVYKLKDKYF
ncbi:unnamed protein product [Ixodes pacificus]